MTIAALRALLADIDRDGGPEAARTAQYLIRGERTTVNAPLTPAEKTPALSVAHLLNWAAQHPDAAVQADAEATAAALVRLRERHAADLEMDKLSEEEEELERRLTAIRGRRAELEPEKPKKKRGPLDHQPAVVRAWARAHHIPCSGRGRVPQEIVDRWKVAHSPAARESQAQPDTV